MTKPASIPASQAYPVRVFACYGEQVHRHKRDGCHGIGQQESWIKAQIESSHFDNESEVVREIIRERQLREQETAVEIAAIRASPD